MNNPYDVLGISKTATEDEIKSSFRKLALQFHPDRNPGDEAAATKFKEVSEAYEILSDANKKAEYDSFGTVGKHHHHRANPFPDFDSIFEGMFGGGSQKGRNIQCKVELELKDILVQCPRSVKVNQYSKCDKCEGKGFTDWVGCKTCSGSGKQFVVQPPFKIFQTCKECAGTGRESAVDCKECTGSGFKVSGHKNINVDIPAGIDSGMQIRIPGEGEPSKVPGRNPGDLFLIVIVKDHPFFQREGGNLIVDFPVTFSQLVFGAKLNIKDLKNEKLKFEIKPGSLDPIVLKNLGVPVFNNKKLGDIVIRPILEIPKNIKKDYKSAVEKLAEMEEKYPSVSVSEFSKKMA